MSRPILLDLFCGGGGAAVGYHRAGFDVVGVDIAPQPHYPFEFHQMNALEWPATSFILFDAIHASPPCQAYSVTRSLHDGQHPELIDGVREMLRGTGVRHVIENVVGAPLENCVTLCGSAFGLGVRRHRRFETNWTVWAPPSCRHDEQPEPIDVTGTGAPAARPTGQRGGIHRKPRSLAEARSAMGIDWMSRRELSQAIPPAYTEFIGGRLLSSLAYEVTQ